MSKQTIHLVGGGLVGALTAIYLAQRDFKVKLYERRGDMRKGRVEAGRSINLAVTARGLQALEKVGLLEEVLKLAIPMRGRMLHDTEGKTTFVPYSQKAHEYINSVSRGELNKLLLTKAGGYKNVEMFFDMPCTGYDIAASTVHFGDKKIPAEVVIGTDGGGSVLRRLMLDRLPHFNYSQSFQTHGYKELVIPGTADGGFLIEKEALHIWPRGSFMLIALPNLDGSFTCTLFFPYEGAESFATLNTPESITRFFKQHFGDALAVMPTFVEDFFNNPTGSLGTVKCSPWHIGGKVGLMGDAAHAIVPFYGQGMNCGFEDCLALGNLLDAAKGEPDWNAIFKALEAERKPNSDAIADMAVENFIEMRDTVANPRFQLKKQIGFELEKRFPEKFIPRYSMVVFHPEIPYAEAKRRGDEQEKILDILSEGINNLQQVDWDKARDLVQ